MVRQNCFSCRRHDCKQGILMNVPPGTAPPSDRGLDGGRSPEIQIRLESGLQEDDEISAETFE